MPNVVVKNDPIDLSFLSYLHPSFIPDRETNDFTDLKIFLDLLLILYQSNRSMDDQLKRRAMTCTPFRLDLGNGQRCSNDFFGLDSIRCRIGNLCGDYGTDHDRLRLFHPVSVVADGEWERGRETIRSGFWSC